MRTRNRETHKIQDVERDRIRKTQSETVRIRGLKYAGQGMIKNREQG